VCSAVRGADGITKHNRLWAQEDRLIFDGDESKYELWEVKFLGYVRLQKQQDVFVRDTDEKEAPSAARNNEAFAELA